MECVAQFIDGPYFKVLTNGCDKYWHLEEKLASVRWDDGRFCLYRIPPHDFQGSGEPDANGADVPVLARVIRPTLRERMFGGAMFHDAAFHQRLQVKIDGKGPWLPANLTMEEANQLLRGLMFLEAVTEGEREIVFQVLQWYGGRAWKEDAKEAAALETLPSQSHVLTDGLLP